ncbi:SDR family NAD(P)-dependent oxidoreductase [Saccharopolyspora sp. K220]|uniref:SDR family NAD(P)-dependent oxidoreductase n=1 Tax=Saccharopolyspora soli TaxID=2926618 RepID=UPI001F5AF94D|nr:SDR family NAD(P)-dependent oxidoreductase [Saccharopolyspora soli]MCI2419527.1 SDR family NAD(P)-dependent oxidoreductase [Saccharopolyspora soli]
MTNSANTAAVRTWFITGATSGIGRELTALALGRGDNVAAAARKADQIRDLAERHPGKLIAIDTDVRDEASVRAAVDRAAAAFGRIDVVANNAGYGLFGAVEEASDVQARALFDTNVFGVLNVLRATLPVLRQQSSGHVLQGSSLYGQTAHPGVGLLAASKYAVEGLTDALVAELAPLGIKVTLIQPGPTSTAFLSNLDLADAIPSYDETVRTTQKAISELPPTAFSTPVRVAEGILAAVDAETPPLRLALGTSSAADMRTALHARLAELDRWADVSNAVDR